MPMPTYEYACKSCGQHLEVVQSFRDDPLTVCPSCGGPLRKVFGSIGISFKGSGFYRTDSRSGAKASGSGQKDQKDQKDSAPKEGKESKVDASAKGASESKSDSKPKADTKSA